MCSVVGCGSWRHSAQRFKLPEDPERRLEWVQFLAEANKQRFKESSWTDITICSEHFSDDCFDQWTVVRSGVTDMVQLTLHPSAVPSLCVPPEEAEDGPDTVVIKIKSTATKPPAEKPPAQKRREEKPSAEKPPAEDQHLTEAAEETPESQQAESAEAESADTDVPEMVAVINEESDSDSSGLEKVDSDDDWEPDGNRVLKNKPEEESEDGEDDEEDEEEDEDDGDYPPLPVRRSRLCTECGVFFNKRKPHTCEHKIKPFSCNICGKRCVSENALITHNRIHNENYEYSCKYCQDTFKTKVDKMTHEQVHRTQGKPYKCPDCPETFATNKDREVHLEDHRGPKQLKCHVCGIEFGRPLYLRRHMAVHTGMKPFKCSVCQRGFSQASHLKSHMRLHTGERPFKCQHCDTCFNHNVSLKSHVQRYHSSREDKLSEPERPRGRTSGRPIGRPKRGGGELQGGDEEQIKRKRKRL